MSEFLPIIFLLIESFLAVSLIFILYGFRKKIGYIPFYTYINFLVLTTRLVDDFGLTINIGEISFFVSSSILFTAILLSLFIVYVFDGPEAGRMAVIIVILATVGILIIHYLIQMQSHYLAQPPAILLKNLNLKFYLLSIFALLGDLVLLGIAWEYSNRFQKKIPLVLRLFAVLLITMWFDALLFIPGAFWGNPALLDILRGSLLSRLILSLMVLPFLWAFFYREQKDKDLYFEERPVFAIVQSSMVEKELKSTRLRAVRSEEALSEIESRFDLALSKAPTPLMLFAEDGEVILINEMWEEKSGYKFHEIRNLASWTRHAYGENALEYEQKIRKNITIETTIYEGEFEIRTKSGDIRIWDFSSTPLGKLSDGRKIIMSMAVDITDRKKAEMEFMEQERRFREMIENVGLIVTMLDAEGNITYVNDFLLDLTDWQREEIVGKNWFEMFISQEEFSEVQQVFIDALVSQEMSIYHENAILTKSGKERIIRWSNIMLKDYHGEVIGTASMGEDITERKEIEDKINRLNENLENQVQLRTAELKITVADLEAFAYSVSHDLRAPLRAIKGYTDILKADYLHDLDDEGKRYFTSISDSTLRMDELITGLLAFSRLGRQGLETEAIDFDELVAVVTKELKTDGYANSEIIIDFLGVHRGDRNLIRQVYKNLIENALKFSAKLENPSIHIGISHEKGQPVFFVRDNGIGFDMTYSEKAFGVFQRLHSSESYTGSGIGLSIAQRIIERHGGEIWVESAEGQGTTFYFVLSQFE